MMNAALVGNDRDCDQNEHDDEHHTLFVRREFENSEQAFHVSAAQLWYPFGLGVSLFS